MKQFAKFVSVTIVIGFIFGLIFGLVLSTFDLIGPLLIPVSFVLNIVAMGISWKLFVVTPNSK